MKRLIICTLLVLGVQATGMAQPDKKKIKEAKLEFMKTKLRLTTDEEKKFVPLYTQYTEEMEKLRSDFRQETDLADLDLTFMDDKECEKVNNDIIAFREKELALFKKYNEEFKKVLPVKKVTMIYKSELEFKKELLRELRVRKKENNKKKK